MPDLAYYTTQSRNTDPGGMAHWFTGLPTDIDGLQRVARGLVIHYRADDPIGKGIPEVRLQEIDTRYAEAMLRRLHELDPRPLIEERRPQQRLVGCCRDFTVLYLAMARHLGIPSRARVGFAGYFVRDFAVDHEVAEVWDAAQGRWRLLDPELGSTFVDATDGQEFSALDLPRDRFITGADAWLACRAGEGDPEQFVVDPNLDVPVTRSWPQLAFNLVHDLSALNKAEMLRWDGWGLLNGEPPDDATLALLDRVAHTIKSTETAPGAPAELRDLYESSPDLRVPDLITSVDVLTGAFRQVAVTV